MITRWIIDKSYMADVPPSGYLANNINELKGQIQATADNKKLRTDRPPIGCLEFRWELNNNNEPDICHVYFLDSNSVRKRFMRLRRA